MNVLKFAGWLATALLWGFQGWRITPPVFSNDWHDGLMVGLAFCVVVLSFLGSALENLEKALRA